MNTCTREYTHEHCAYRRLHACETDTRISNRYYHTHTYTRARAHVHFPIRDTLHITRTRPARARTHARTHVHTHPHTKTCAFEVTHKEAPCSLQSWREGRQRCVRHLMNETWSESPRCMHLILLFISFPPPQLTASALNKSSSSPTPLPTQTSCTIRLPPPKRFWPIGYTRYLGYSRNLSHSGMVFEDQKFSLQEVH